MQGSIVNAGKWRKRLLDQPPVFHRNFVVVEDGLVENLSDISLREFLTR